MPTSTSPLRRFAAFCAAAAFLLILAGGMVTSTGSGLAVPDWPLSYGQAMPRMVGGVLFEHGHRMIAGIVGLLTWVLAAWVWKVDERRWVRLLAAAAALGIVVQAGLGAVTVLYGLPPSVSALHACLGQALFCALLCLWDASRLAPSGTGASAAVGFFAAGSLFAQLALGAVYRHTGGGLAFHLLGAGVAVAAVGALARRALVLDPRPSWGGPAYALMGLIPLQLVLGLVALVARTRRLAPRVAAFAGLGGDPSAVSISLAPALLTAAHVACGAALLGAAAVWTQRALRESGRLA